MADEKEKSGESKNLDNQQSNKPAPTPEEIEAIAKENASTWFSDEPLIKKEKPAEPTEESSAAAPAASDAPAPAAPAAPANTETPAPEAPEAPALAGLESDGGSKPEEKPPVEKPQPQRALSDEEIEDVADRIASRIVPEDKKNEPKPDPFAEFTGEDRAQLETLEFLGKRDPRFKGRDIAAETIKFWKSESDYISQWEAKHSGETFNEEDPEHAEFYRKNEPKGVSEYDITAAREQKIVEEAKREAKREVEKEMRQEIDRRLAPIEREKLEQEKAPVIRNAINAAVVSMVQGLVPTAVKDGAMSREALKKIEDEDPVTFQLLDEESAALNVRIRELERLRQLGEHFQFDEQLKVKVAGEVIKPHQEIVDTAYELEEEKMALPEKERVKDGKLFLTRDDRIQRVEQIQKSKLPPEEKARRLRVLDEKTWSIGIDDISAAFVEKSVRRVNKTLEIANKRNGAANGKGTDKDKKPVAVAPSAPLENKENSPKTPPPAISGSSDLVNTRVPASPQGKSQAELNAASWFS